MLLAHVGAAQTSDGWKILEAVELKSKWNEAHTYQIDYPVFQDKLKERDQTEIVLTGYVLPLETKTASTKFVFSKYPFNQCYFCGGAGPETIIEVNSTKAISYSEDKVVIKGTLQLNETDPEHHMYVLNAAALVK